MARGVFLDTNVYIDWADGLRLDLRRLLARNGISIFLSPSTIFEGIEDYWTCPKHRLGRHRQRRDRFHSHLRRWLRFAIGLSPMQRQKAQNAQYQFDKSTLLSLINRFRESYVHLLESTRDELITRLAPKGGRLASSDNNKVKQALRSAEWEQIYFEKLFRELLQIEQPIAFDLQRSRPILAAAFAFETAILESTIIDGYNPQKHPGDAFDAAHLKHLATEGLKFVTSDTRILRHTRGSAQETRVLNAADVTLSQLI